MAVGKCKPLPPISEKRAKLFWRMVAIREEAECWLWRGRIGPKGYSQIMIDGNMCLVHRLAYFLTTGQDPYPMGVLHKCINSRSCCNPAHLYLGNDLDNARDRTEQDQHRPGGSRGEWHYATKLTEEDVRQIRLLAKDGTPHPRIAERFDITRSAVSSIVRRKNWKCVE